MKIYQDLLEIGEHERDRMEFVLDAIREHKGSEFYKDAEIGERYYRQDTDILRYVKTVTNQLGQKVPYIWSANNKIATYFYNYFTTQKFLIFWEMALPSKTRKPKRNWARTLTSVCRIAQLRLVMAQRDLAFSI